MHISRALAPCVVFVAAVAFAGAVGAVEGKWLPEQVPQLDPAMLKQLGLQLPPQALWNDKTGTGLLSAAINLNGCSASFISGTGLVITNHHCVFGIIAEHATPDRNLLEDGFVAHSRAEELPGTTSRLRVPVAFTDVTADVNGAAGADVSDRERFIAVDRKKKDLVAACEQTPGRRCDVATFYGGLRHIMMEQVELRDVRLVYAPPRAVGEFGGETDNWMWPRHSGDFAIVRAYATPTGGPSTTTSPDNVPWKPAFHFPISQHGTKAGDFVMVLGYPGYTVRELLAEEMQHRATMAYPWLMRWSDEIIATLEAVSDREGAIAVAPQLKSQHNRRKNAAGQLAGLARGHIIDKKQASDAEVLTWAVTHPHDAEATTAHALLLEELHRKEAAFERDALLSQVLSGSKGLAMAVKLARMTSEREKPDLERDPSYMERERPRLLSELVRDQKALFVPADKAMFLQFVRRALALPPDQRIAAIDRTFARSKTERALKAQVDAIYKTTKVLKLSERERMGGEPARALKARKDPLLTLAFGINEALDAKKLEEDRREGASLRIRPVWMQAVLAKAGRPVAPDANGTLRVSFATVKGYDPQDGLRALPYSSLTGMFAKHTGAEPFAVPTRLQDVGARGLGPRFMAKQLEDVPVNFLADADTTGGNSGSPVVNGRGELVGVNFDRVWENVANDFGYNPAIARNVSVDIRYVLWMLHDVDHATELLAELGITDP